MKRKVVASVVVFGCAIALAVGPAPSASAHPSDFETLTLDFLIGPHGLETIDAALVTVPGPSYLPFPSESARRDVAAEVVESLGARSDEVDTDAAMAERYHEVGFTIRFLRPYANAGPGEIRVNTHSLQQLALAAHVEKLNLKLCDGRQSEVGAQPVDATSTPVALQTRATESPTRSSDRSINDRPGCEIWIVAVNDRPFVVFARLGSDSLAITGADERVVIAAFSLVAVGLVLLAAGWRSGASATSDEPSQNCRSGVRQTAPERAIWRGGASTPSGRLVPMTDPVEFRSDLYRGTASYYDRYRLSYPTELISDLVSRASLDGTGRLLDVACGTGQLAFALQPFVAEVVGIDQEEEMVDYASERASSRGLPKMQWATRRAEEFSAAKPFDLATIGNAFHRLRRSDVAERARQWLVPGGHLALVESSAAHSGPAPWQRVLEDCVKGWAERVGVNNRIPEGWDTDIARRPHAAVLAAAGFNIVGRYDFVDLHDWTVDELVGFLYSTSFFPRAALGPCAVEFETDLAQRLFAVEPSGVFREEITAAYDLATTPAPR